MSGLDLEMFHTGDMHIGSCRQVHEYMERASTLCNSITEVVKASKAKYRVLVVAGDIHHGKHPTEQERNLIVAFILDMLNLGVYVVIIEGNHDHYQQDGTTMIDVFMHIRQLSSKYLHVVTNNPGVIDIQLGASGVSFLCLPCKQDLTTKKLKNILGTLKSEAKYDLAYGVVHEAINGSIANDNHSMKTKCDIPSISSIRGIMLGDIHHCQKVGARAWYCGSPYQTKFDESKHKGILLWKPEIDDPELILLKRVPKLIKVSDPKDLAKYKDTKHTVHYVGKERVEIDEPNITLHRNLKVIEESAYVDMVVEETRHSALLGLREHLEKDGLSAEEVLEGYTAAEQEVMK